MVDSVEWLMLEIVIVILIVIVIVPNADCPSALHLPCRSEFVYSIMVTNSVLERFVWCIRDSDELNITINAKIFKNFQI
jgi:hypothetical protein